MPITRKVVVETKSKVVALEMAFQSFVSHCSGNNGGYTIEIISGTGQEIVDSIRDRRLSYGNVDIVGITREGTGYAVIITYIIPT